MAERGVTQEWLEIEAGLGRGHLRDEVVRLLGATKHPSAIAELRKLEPPGPDVSAEYWIRTLDALDAKYRVKKGKTG